MSFLEDSMSRLIYETKNKVLSGKSYTIVISSGESVNIECAIDSDIECSLNTDKCVGP